MTNLLQSAAVLWQVLHDAWAPLNHWQHKGFKAKPLAA